MSLILKKNMKTTESKNPLEHTSNIKEEFAKLSSHLRHDIEKIEEPQAKAMFEVSAEVIDGLQKAFTDYEQKNESAWQNKNPFKE